jgi:hypothetical protein
MQTMSYNKSPAPPPHVPDYIRKSLVEIIDYLWADELKHVWDLESNHRPIYLGEHIFAHLVNVRAWLEPGYVPDAIQSQVTTLAKYILHEFRRFEFPGQVLDAASRLVESPRDALSMSQLLDCFGRALDETGNSRTPDEVRDTLDEIQRWVDAVLKR